MSGAHGQEEEQQTDDGDPDDTILRVPHDNHVVHVQGDAEEEDRDHGQGSLEREHGLAVLDVGGICETHPGHVATLIGLWLVTGDAVAGVVVGEGFYGHYQLPLDGDGELIVGVLPGVHNVTAVGAVEERLGATGSFQDVWLTAAMLGQVVVVRWCRDIGSGDAGRVDTEEKKEGCVDRVYPLHCCHFWGFCCSFGD